LLEALYWSPLEPGGSARLAKVFFLYAGVIDRL
jgi:hypothetical protein